MPDNGRPKTDVGQKLINRDFGPMIGSLGYSRMISKAMLTSLLGEFDPEYIGYRRLYAMRRDPMVQMGLHYLKAPLIKSQWHVECEDPQIAAGVDKIIRNVYGNYMRTGLTKFDFGYQAAIKQFVLGNIEGTYEDEDGAVKEIWADKNIKPVVLDKLIPLPPEFVIVNIDEKNGQFKGFKTTLQGMLAPTVDDKKRQVPAEFALWWVNEFEESFRNYYGYPRTGYAFRYWWSYWFRHHMQDRHFEQDADPPLKVSYPKGNYTDETGTIINNREVALEIGEDLRGGATVAVPSDFYTDDMGRQVALKKWDMEFLKGGENLKAFMDSANYLDIMKLRSILIPEQALVQSPDQPSSRNVQTGYEDIFKQSLALEALENDGVYNAYVIPQILEANWGADAPEARKKTTGFDDDSMQLAVDLIKLAFQVDPNAMPINFDKLVKQANLPTYTAEEQKQREEEAQQKMLENQQAMQQAGGGQQEGQQPNGGPPANQQTAGDNANINASGQYVKARPTLHLSEIPQQGRQAFARRQANVHAMQSRIQTVAQRRYELMFEQAAAYLADIDMHLGLAQDTPQEPAGARRKLQEALVGAEVTTQATNVTEAGTRAPVVPLYPALKAAEVTALVGLLHHFLSQETAHYEDPLTGELASMYHAVGAAELQRLGLDQTSWDVGRDEIQVWAQERAAELVKTMDRTVVQDHLKPFLEHTLNRDFDPASVADKMVEKFSNYPHWMAERVARTESRMGFNQSAIDMWERVGVQDVVAYDGFGGKTGKTDPECLARNGQTYSIDEARDEDRREHPNGTLIFDPILTTQIHEIEPPLSLSQTPLRSSSVYVIRDGYILTEQDTGQVLADGA